MDGEERDILRGLGLAMVALASAILTATLVIGIGSVLMRGALSPAGLMTGAPPDLTSVRS